MDSMLKKFIFDHEVSMDGQSSGFDTFSWVATGRPTYDHPYKIPSIIQ